MKLLLMVCFTLCVVTCKAQLVCPAYWTLFDQSCYRLFGYPRFYTAAESVCQLFTPCGTATPSTAGQGHLVSINSDEENKFVFSFLAGRFGEIPSTQTWLGLSDIDPQGGQGEFRWADGTDLGGFSAWASNAPRQNNNVNCVVYAESIIPRWMDINCEEELTYICEMPAGISACSASYLPSNTNPPPAPLTSPNKPERIRYSAKANRYQEQV
ncbi:echinoidin-like [Acanthaster planci]|uniref:Echinoidin-like n=1 Tax=Acanthaster planci TaxID=133434 RepID=A0A8B7YXH8_ACAPL|nr:echinoidin-like [Acanthaster planci]